MDDQGNTLRRLQNGSVLGAMTPQARPVQGCNVHPVGAMRYLAIASPSFARRHFADGADAAHLVRGLVDACRQEPTGAESTATKCDLAGMFKQACSGAEAGLGTRFVAIAGWVAVCIGAADVRVHRNASWWAAAIFVGVHFATRE